MPIDPAVPPSTNPEQRLLERIASLERQVAELQRARFGPVTFYDTRTDLADGVGPRLEIGKDASVPPVYRITRWSQTGVQTTATFV